jgi:hypothetical protein
MITVNFFPTEEQSIKDPYIYRKHEHTISVGGACILTREYETKRVAVHDATEVCTFQTHIGTDSAAETLPETHLRHCQSNYNLLHIDVFVQGGEYPNKSIDPPCPSVFVGKRH